MQRSVRAVKRIHYIFYITPSPLEAGGPGGGAESKGHGDENSKPYLYEEATRIYQ